jgi:hypothetical protein
VSDVAATTPISKVSVFLTVVRRSGPHVLEASLIPTALFYCFLVLIGLGAAFVAALVWSYAALGLRLARHRPVPPLLVLGVIGITVRTSLAVASGSSFVYFVQPIMGAAVMAAVFVVSIVIGRPLVQHLALEFWPVPADVMARPAVANLFRGLTLLWAGVNAVIALTTMALLLVLPLATFVAVKQIASLVITGVGIAVTIDAAVRTARREGIIAQAAAGLVATS